MELLVLNSDRGVETAIDLIGQMIVSKEKPIVVMLADPGCGMGSKVADRIKSSFGASAAFIQMDDYLKEFASGELNKIIKIDNPDYIDFDRLNEDIKILRKRQHIQKPTFDRESGKRTGYASFWPKSIVVVEGPFALHEKIRWSGDFHIFVDVESEPMRAESVLPTRDYADIVIMD